MFLVTSDLFDVVHCKVCKQLCASRSTNDATFVLSSVINYYVAITFMYVEEGTGPLALVWDNAAPRISWFHVMTLT